MSEKYSDPSGAMTRQSRDVLFVCSVFDLQLGAGTAERTFQFARELSKTRAVGLITTTQGEFSKRLSGINDLDVVVMKCINNRFNIFVPQLYLLRRVIRRYQYIHLIGHWDLLNAICFLIAKRCGVKVIFCPAGAAAYYGRSIFIKKIYNLIIGKKIIRSSDFKICVTEDERSHFASYDVASDEVSVIPNGVNILNNVERKINEGKFFLYLGRLNYIKGVDILVDAYAALCEMGAVERKPLYIVGPDDGLKKDLVDRINKTKFSHLVQFIDFTDGNEKEELFANAIVTIVPSRSEAMSIVALEAVASGSPVIASDVCGLEMLLKFSVNASFRPQVNSLTEALRFFLTNPNELHFLYQNQRNVVESGFSWDIQAKRLMDLLGFS